MRFLIYLPTAYLTYVFMFQNETIILLVFIADRVILQDTLGETA